MIQRFDPPRTQLSNGGREPGSAYMIVQQQGSRAEGKRGVTEAKFRENNGHDAEGGERERGAMEPPTIIVRMVQHH